MKIKSVELVKSSNNNKKKIKDHLKKGKIAKLEKVQLKRSINSGEEERKVKSKQLNKRKVLKKSLKIKM